MTPSKTAAEWVAKLADSEELSIVRGLGSLAFVRAQGRTLEERSQEKILDLLWAIRGELDSILSRDAFDERHHAWIERVVQVLRTNRQTQLAYGQGQKTINVFLKFYVDWASRPTADVAASLRPWLHCPLDKVVMEALRTRDTDSWRRRIWEPHYRGRVAAPATCVDVDDQRARVQGVAGVDPRVVARETRSHRHDLVARSANAESRVVTAAEVLRSRRRTCDVVERAAP